MDYLAALKNFEKAIPWEPNKPNLPCQEGFLGLFGTQWPSVSKKNMGAAPAPWCVKNTKEHDASVDEAVAERAAILEFDGGLDRETAEQLAKGAARDYYDHIFRQEESGCGCRTNLGALVARFCPEGQRLRDDYRDAVAQAEARRTRRMAP